MWVGPLPSPLRSYYDLQNSLSNVAIFAHTAMTLTNISDVEKKLSDQFGYCSTDFVTVSDRTVTCWEYNSN